MGLFRVGLVVLRIGLGLIALEFWKVVFGFLLKLLVRGSHKCKQVQIMCSTGGFATFLAGGAALGKVQHLAQKRKQTHMVCCWHCFLLVSPCDETQFLRGTPRQETVLFVR